MLLFSTIVDKLTTFTEKVFVTIAGDNKPHGWVQSGPWNGR